MMNSPRNDGARSIDTVLKTGIGLRRPHFPEFFDHHHDIGFLEIHSENFFYAGQYEADLLEKVKAEYPLSFHCLGLSLGTVDGINKNSLAQLKKLAQQHNPLMISDHLSWSGTEKSYTPDLLPVPFTKEVLNIFIKNINTVQGALGRSILIENPSSYLSFKEADYEEADFLNTLCEKTGCGLLLDINNIYVSAQNIGFNPEDYLNTINYEHVFEIHLAGYQMNDADGVEILIDAHNNPVYQPVWDLYEKTLKQSGDKNTLIEWDTNIPSLSVLLGEASKADAIREKLRSKNSPNKKTQYG